MKTSYLYTLSLLLMGGFCQSLSAQEQDNKKDNSLERELTIEKEFTPMVRDASKINVLPGIEAPQIKKANIRYSDWAMPVTPAAQLTMLPAAGTDIIYPFSKKKGYADFGIGNYMNINADAGYQILNTEQNQLTIGVLHQSANGNVNYIEAAGKNKLKLNDNRVNLAFRHKFNKLAWGIDLNYRYNQFNYYGHTPFAENEYNLFDTTLLPQFGSDQIAQQIALSTYIEANKENAVYYRASLGFNRYANKLGSIYGTDGASENNVHAALELATGMSTDYRIGLRAQLETFFYSNATSLKQLSMISRTDSLKNYAMVSLNPYFNIGKDQFNLQLGVNADVTFNQGTVLRMAPKIRMDWEFTDSFFLYLGAEGGKIVNSFAHLAQETIYFDPTMRPVDSYMPLDAKLGFRSNYFYGFWFDVNAGYKVVKDDALGSTWGIGYIDRANQILSHNTVSFLSADTKAFYAGVTLKYKYNSLLDFTLRGQFNDWKSDPENVISFTRPKAEIEFNGTVFFTPKVSLDLNYYLATGRKYMGGVQLSAGSNSTVRFIDGDLKNINALDMRANYQLTDYFNIFVKANNLLSQKYDFWYGMPAQGISVMGGVGFKF